MSILEEIFANKRREVARAKQSMPEKAMMAAAAAALPSLDFIAGLHTRTKKLIASQGSDGESRPQSPALIAEIKAASPSKGVLVSDFNPLHLAEIYAAEGASAISVLTDSHYFKGNLDILRQVRTKFPKMPLLRKDFIFDPYQVYEARAAGADAILLIAAMLKIELLANLQDLAENLGMAALVEIHSEAELRAVLQVSPRLVGINNRDLHSFRINLGISLALLPMLPPNITAVAESGIYNQGDVRRLAEAGTHAILVGEALVTAPDIARKVQELVAVQMFSNIESPRRKYCEG